MPMKNASKWVKETIESIQKQNAHDWELIVIDDHSTDDSQAIVDNLASKDQRIQCYKNNSTGIISALQQALKLAKGSYITRMDSDDLFTPNRLNTMREALEKLPRKSIVTGKVSYFSKEKVSEGYQSYEKWLNERVINNDFYEHIYRECIVASPNWMGRTKEFEEHQLFHTLNYPEDYDLCLRWYEQGFSIHGINKITLLWREHPQRTSRNSVLYQQEQFFRLKIEWFAKHFSHISSIGIIGVGNKGKLCAKFLSENQCAFHLYDLNHQQYTTPLFGQTIASIDDIQDSIVLIARYPKDTRAIQNFIESKGYIIGKTAFWV